MSIKYHIQFNSYSKILDSIYFVYCQLRKTMFKPQLRNKTIIKLKFFKSKKQCLNKILKNKQSENKIKCSITS